MTLSDSYSKDSFIPEEENIEEIKLDSKTGNFQVKVTKLLQRTTNYLISDISAALALDVASDPIL